MTSTTTLRVREIVACAALAVVTVATTALLFVNLFFSAPVVA